MTGLNPNDIHELRLALGWSAREMGEFFNRTGVTIYHWENGKSSPGNNVSVLVKALRQELSWRKEKCSEKELQQWIGQLLDKGIEALLGEITLHFAPGENTPSCQHIVHLATKHGGVTIRSQSGQALAYVVPNTTPGLLRWARNLLEMTTGEEHLTGLSSSLPDQVSDSDVTLPTP